jgi:shikimate kinase
MGGGSILRPSNVEIMRRTGTLVLLTASTAEITDRIGDADDRPLAAGTSALPDLATSRQASYEDAADVTVDTDGKSPDIVAEEVMMCNVT